MSRLPPSDYAFAEHERPMAPGSPYSPEHPGLRRLGYVGVAIITSLAATLGNGLVTVNLPTIAGNLGVYAAEASLLPAAYVAMNVCANLILIKARIQFGIPAMAHVLLAAYAAAGLLQFVVPGFGAALLVRGVCGMAAAGLSTLTIYNLLQATPTKLRPAALVIGVSLGQFGPALARMFPVEMLAIGSWQGLHLIEVALALAALAALLALPLPPSDRSPAFERLDFVTIGLFAPAMMLLCAVLGVGRTMWWTDTPWLGVALAAAVPLFAAAFAIEHYRARPLLQTKWIGTWDMARFVVVATMVRVALAEQTYGAVGLLTTAGLTNDQLHLLFGVVIVAMVLGLATALVTLSAERIPYLVIAAALIVALGAWMDTHSTNLTRPAQLMWSQGLIAFGATLFIGPALVFGFLRMMERGTDHMITFIVLFSMSQNLGGLAGSALLGSYQVISAREHATTLAERALLTDPAVAARLQATGGGLSQALGREASILAFNDVFQLVAVIAVLTALYILYIRILAVLRRRRTGTSA